MSPASGWTPHQLALLAVRAVIANHSEAFPAGGAEIAL
jgi:hypothetical protein